MQNATLTIDGMNGEACADLVTLVLNNITGVSDVRVSLLNSQASLKFDENHTSQPYLITSLARAGYTARAGQAEKAGGCCGGCCGG
ncbi:heavy-metal-associated domain-containing protein [Rugamonas apoptosis]|uniref:Heavy-metal-associated domain-containing protein n=1 Tax=Rugamonas apoptosis TaxID=2758570 RepID=A0A7W2IKJ3_9BURK|nr:heavy-metal-associated domain-containing protein [Rugamonas apoptosis]MBA5687421.1 heavy-metal-associated domain-containing protein [Rugamonas apoptosis]